MARLHAAKCPTCGANIHVDPGAASAVCRYCQNVITLERRAPPPTVTPFGMPGGTPSRTLYIDPKAVRRTGGAFITVIVLTTILPILVPLGIFVGGPLYRAAKGSVRPFPATCGPNESLTLSGNFDGPGPAITSVGVNCKIEITGSKIKAASLIESAGPNFELTITDSVIETTGAALQTGVNTKLRIKGGSLKSGGPAVEAGSNLEVWLDATTLESTSGAAIVAPGIDLQAKGAAVRGATSALDIESNAKVKAEATVFEAGGPALVLGGNAKLGFTGGSVTSKTDRAIEAGSNMELTVAGTKVEGVTGAVVASEANAKIKASDKASFVATDGHALEVATNGKLTLGDVTVEGSRLAIKAAYNVELMLKPGAHLSGKRGGVLAEGNFKIDANGASIDGGTGAGLEASSAEGITMRGGTVKGSPALRFLRKPSKFEVEGTQIVGAKEMR